MSRVAFFRPDDERAASAAEFVRGLGAEPLSDPMLAIEPTGETPRSDADYTVLTSKTGAELVDGGGWHPSGAIVAIGTPTADALEAAGYAVERRPSEFSSSGLVAELAADAPGATIEVARSDHGSQVLLDGLNDAGAYVHETVLYRLVRPDGAGESAEAAADGELAGACFTSSLTVEHFLGAAAERGIRTEAIDGLNAATVGAIGEPTRETAEAAGIDVDVVPKTAEFEALAEAVVERR
ncbi:uroporphyrinogen-III synthase [Natronomonas sp. LN261]|jgi:uroporphyrinogen-III synthase|uniref:uroporphyrinogen-III synthase n=1 Tax=Natronomonas sp. LN261 TaxID=2750669 RepID=UPI0015EF2333|nr:uroporphyrinogen-III synthase [Natronomonas sp. LN261]